MTVLRMEHVGVVVDDLAAATEFFLLLGLKLEGETSVGGTSVDRIIGLDGSKVDVVIVQAPGGQGKVELAKFQSPPALGERGRAPANTLGIRHLLFAVEDIDSIVAR